MFSLDTKCCGKCKKHLPIDQFQLITAKSGRNKGNSWRNVRCKACHNEYMYERKLMKVFNMTLFEYDQMASMQSHGCAICGGKCSTNSRLSVDHCHTSGKVRGLLCMNCNTAIGQMQDNPERMIAAANYLRKAEGFEPLKISGTPIDLSHEAVDWVKDPNVCGYEVSGACS